MANIGFDIREAIDADGFFLSPRLIDDAAISGLVDAFADAEKSDHARSSRGETYALRNILKAVPDVLELATSPALLEAACAVLGKGAMPVKAIMFDKTSAVNWNLRWHQDNVISVREKRDVPGFHGWSVKVGISHVRPPVEILEQMLAARVHIDDCDGTNGALKVIPGSHAHGRLPDQELQRWKQERPQVICAAKKGEVLFMRPLLLHSSDRAVNPKHRRVLHIEYAAGELPDGLEWGV